LGRLSAHPENHRTHNDNAQDDNTMTTPNSSTGKRLGLKERYAMMTRGLGW